MSRSVETERTDHERIRIAAPDIGHAERERVDAVLQSGMLAAGDEVDAFEREFAAVAGTDHAVATSNGTTALHAALNALGLGAGDRVLTTPFSFVASTNAIRLCGAEPVFADVDPATFTLDPQAVEDVIRESDGAVDAILVVHLYGLAAAMDHLVELADEYDLLLIEDAAQAHGATFRGEPVGSFGDVGCFSFYPTKNVTTGEGGMVTTDHEDVARRAARFINHGRPTDATATYEHVAVGHNFRLTDVAAAIGRAQLEKLDRYTERRRANAARFDGALVEGPVEPPVEPTYAGHVYHQYTVRCDERDALASHLDDHGIDTGVYYPTPIHQLPAYDGIAVELPAAETAAEQVLSLPVHPGLSEADLTTIETAIQSYATND